MGKSLQLALLLVRPWVLLPGVPLHPSTYNFGFQLLKQLLFLLVKTKGEETYRVGHLTGAPAPSVDHVIAGNLTVHSRCTQGNQESCSQIRPQEGRQEDHQEGPQEGCQEARQEACQEGRQEDHQTRVQKVNMMCVLNNVHALSYDAAV